MPTDNNELPIPQPPTHLFVGNLPDIDASHMLASYRNLTKQYGSIFALDMVRARIVYCGSQALVNDICDESKFEKIVAGALYQVRHLAGSGLFTAQGWEADWALAHKLLMPAFGPLAIRKMFPEMVDILGQMLMRWQRFGSEHEIDVSDNFTRLTLDTIALCSFDYRFNSFYRDDMHPFVNKALDALLESGRRAGRTDLEVRVRRWSQEKYDSDIAYCWRVCDEIVADRKANPKEVNDLLNAMLKARDPETGEKMRDELIRYEMMTFLLAGHDTTGGLLSFTFLMMLKHPRVLHRAQAEVDEVLGNDALEVKHIEKLKYIEAVLRETIRLHPTVPNIGVHTKSGEDVLIGGGKYRIKGKDVAMLGIAALHRDPKVWGDDADEYRPERMLDGGFEALPPNSWKPFGNGVRACIGRGFAWQEATMAVALILQRFQVELADPSYEMNIRQTLTIKPVGWHMKVRLRPGKSIYTGILTGSGVKDSMPVQVDGHKPQGSASGLAPLAIFYGSNQGTCKSFAENLQDTAAAHGFVATVNTLDAATENIPKDRPIVFITPSYEGQPPDNGRKFIAWLESIEGRQNSLSGVKYALFGCGNADWINTYHRIPKLVDGILEKTGARRVCATGLGNAAGDIVDAFDQFSEHLWKALQESSGKVDHVKEELTVEVSVERPQALGEKDMKLGTVRKHIQLADTSIGLEKRMMDVELPEGTSYQAGDYLVVLPTNHRHHVRRVLHNFQMPVDALVKVAGTSKSFLPHDHTEYAFSILGAYVEIGTPISRRQVAFLASNTTDPSQKAEMERLGGPVYESAVLSKRATIIDFLEQFPACEITFAQYLDLLQPMKLRQYSIASSPLASSSHTASILYDVLSSPSRYNHAAHFHGVASSYLADIPVGAKVHAHTRPTNVNFRLPVDPAVPIVMICAGTGLAPMRAFVQERAAIAQAQPGLELGTALLYFGCRDPDKDYICRDELEAWEAAGVVSLRPTFSRRPEESGGWKYVGQRLGAERHEVVKLFRSGAKVFLCGSAGKLARSVNEVLERMVMESKGVGVEEARAWLARQKADRFVSDVYD